MRWKPFGRTWLRKRRMNSSCVERHRLPTLRMFRTIVLVAECNAACAGWRRAGGSRWRRDACSATGKLRTAFGPANGSLGIDDPFGFAQRPEEAGEGRRFGQASACAPKEFEVTFAMCLERATPAFAAGTTVRAHARAGGSSCGRRSTSIHPAICRHRGRSCGHADDASSPSPRCAAPR